MVGRTSPYSLYNEGLATYAKGDEFRSYLSKRLHLCLGPSSKNSSSGPQEEGKEVTEKVLWSGRFKEVAAEDTLAFTSSLAVDKRLARYDVLGSLAHAKMLAKQGIITPLDGDSIAKGLKDILAMIDDGTFLPSGSIEDVHSYVEFLLI